MELQAGTQIDAELRLVRPLREGAQGSVWVAEHTRHGPVAVKLVSHELLRDDTARKRFRREAKLAARMSTKHVPRYLSYGITDEGWPYIAMELLEGEPLSDRLERDGTLSLLEVVVVLEQVAEALAEAHELGIVHRDVKPANIFLSAGDDQALVKVLDFGIARRTGVTHQSVVTEVGTAVGTPDYMSPEQLLDAKRVDHRADVWAMGVVAYRSLVGLLPFVSNSFAALCVTICEGRYIPATDQEPNLPPSIDAWFDKVFQVEPDERFPTASEAVEGLKDVLVEEAAYSLRRGRGSAAVWWVLGTLAALAVGVLAAYLTR